MAAWYIATETTSELKKGGYVQGTVILVLRKRKDGEHGYKDEIVQEVKVEVADQIDTMSGLNQSLKGHGRIENLFEDADLQMAGYAAALRVLTKYTTIDGIDMTKEALRPRVKGERGLVGEIIEFAVQVANEHMVPEGMSPKVWEQFTGAERFFFKMMDIEETGAKKLDNYQNFAKAFRVPKYDDLMGSMEPNKARLKSAKEFKKAGFEGSEFGASKSRALLFAHLRAPKRDRRRRRAIAPARHGSRLFQRPRRPDGARRLRRQEARQHRRGGIPRRRYPAWIDSQRTLRMTAWTRRRAEDA